MFIENEEARNAVNILVTRSIKTMEKTIKEGKTLNPPPFSIHKKRNPHCVKSNTKSKKFIIDNFMCQLSKAKDENQ